jgi:hypothetical protein
MGIYVCVPAPAPRRRSGNTRYTTVGEIVAHPSPSSSAAVEATDAAGSALLLLQEASEIESEEHEEGVLRPPGIRCQYSLRGIVVGGGGVRKAGWRRECGRKGSDP